MKQNSADTAQGHGTLDRARRLFNFKVQSREKDAGSRIHGHLTYVDLEAGFFFRSSEITDFRIEPDGRVASFSGIGVLNGQGDFTFTVHVEDNTRGKGGRDRFRIEILGLGVDYDSLDHALNGGRIDRKGEIRVQPGPHAASSRPVARPPMRPHDFVLDGWSNSGRHEPLVQAIVNRKFAR
jgi:hypothetical protein